MCIAKSKKLRNSSFFWHLNNELNASVNRINDTKKICSEASKSVIWIEFSTLAGTNFVK